jgi:hypothetical protein
MRRMRWITYLWPGLAQLWQHGSWSGLVLALAAAAGLDVLLLVTFGWSELISQNPRNMLWAAFAALWIIAAGWSAGQCRRRTVTAGHDGADEFVEAVDHYLKGDYYQAEHVLEALLRRNTRDLEARLMLATLLRRCGRLDDARGQLDTLARFEGAEKWEMEIRAQRKLLAEAKSGKLVVAA